MAEDSPQGSIDTTGNTKRVISPAQILAAFDRRLRASTSSEQAEATPELKDVDPADYRPLLFGLLQREMDHRQQQGDPITRPELEQRFSQDRELVDALLNQEREPTDIIARITDYEYIGLIHGNPYGGAYKVRHRLTNETRVLSRISAFFVDAAGVSAEQASADMVHLFHPNIAAPIEVIQHRGTVYVISEYFEGENLADFLATAQPVPIPVLCEIISQVSRGVSGIHSFFKAHADIRPANVLIGIHGSQIGKVKLSGVAGGLVDEHKARYAVWPPGMRYAQAFCAPEVISGKHDPDPRSDVFSLGQLLYAALAGQPPLDPQATKIPIGKIRPDCPTDLESAIEQMTAEDPDERFETAGEILPMISKYAVHAQLLAWLTHRERTSAGVQPGVIRDEDSVVVFRVGPQPVAPDLGSRSTGPVCSELETPPSPSLEQAADSKDHSPAAPAPQAGFDDPTGHKSSSVRRKMHRQITLACLGALAALVAGIAVWKYLPAVDPSSAPPSWVVALTELPGPNGDWWFEETPWFTPQVRAELARRVIDNDTGLDHQQLQALSQRLQTHPDYETVTELHDVVKRSIRKMPDRLALVARQIDEIRPEAHSVGELKLEYAGILEELGPGDQDSATGWHLRANLLQASSNPAEAAKAYERALALYAETPTAATTGLQALCASDYAQLLAGFERNYRKANTYYRLGIEHAQSPALDVVCLCLLADSQRKWGRRSDAVKTLTDARRLLQSHPDILAEHPLHAMVAETRGWAAFDTWQLDEATRAFEAAHAIRLAHSQAGNPRSWRAILWIEQGQAMTAHFRGDQKQSQEKYRKLLDQIDSSLKGGFIRDLPKQQRTELAARRPNLYERLADCYMFGAGIDHREACHALTLALQATEDSSFDSQRLWPHILALNYKYSLALSLAGDRTLATQAFQQADQELEARSEQESEITDGQRRVFQSMRNVAQALLQLEGSSPEDRQAAVAALEEYHAAASSQVTRSNIDLVMLVTEELLKPTVLPSDKSARIVRRLNSIIQSLRTADDNRLTSLYLQRYCESGQRALRIASSTSVSLSEPNLSEPMAAVLAESLQQAPLVQRGLTRGSIEYDEKGKPVSCRLHVLTIGVSSYEHHPELELTYADDDADALFAAYGQLCVDSTSNESSGCLFQRGEFRNLKNNEATRAAIIDAINDMSRTATEKDLVIVSLSGHGTVDEAGNFFFLPFDYRDKSLRSSAIWDENLRDMLTRGKSNAILVLDACHSGAATTTGTRAASTQQLHNALYRFTSAQKGLVVLAASLSSQTASENPRFGHGVLTLALLEALQGQYNDAALAETRVRGATIPQLPRPQDNSGLITLADIQYYIGSRVDGLTDGKQRATMNRLGGDLSMRDIPIRFQSIDAN